MTCNANWLEIQSCLCPGWHAYDAPIIVAHAFKNCLQQLQDILCMKMGTLTYITISNKFQKCGYPYSHIALQVSIPFSHSLPPPTNPLQVRLEISVKCLDELIKAHVPNDNPSSNHLTQETSQCRKGNKCIYSFPHPPSPNTTANGDSHICYR